MECQLSRPFCGDDWTHVIPNGRYPLPICAAKFLVITCKSLSRLEVVVKSGERTCDRSDFVS